MENNYTGYKKAFFLMQHEDKRGISNIKRHKSCNKKSISLLPTSLDSWAGPGPAGPPPRDPRRRPSQSQDQRRRQHGC